VDEVKKLFHRHPNYLHELVLVGVGRRGLLDTAGQEEVGPVVLEAGGGGYSAQRCPLATGIARLLREFAAGSSLWSLAGFDEPCGQAELHRFERRAVLADEDDLSVRGEREDYRRVGALDHVVGVFDATIGLPQPVRA
jgi:hypothetical protein